MTGFGNNPPKVENFGGAAMIIDLAYDLFFVGGIWRTDFLRERAGKLARSLNIALKDAELNKVFVQYISAEDQSQFANGKSITAEPSSEWKTTIVGKNEKIIDIEGMIIDEEKWPSVVDRKRLEMFAQDLLTKGKLQPESSFEHYALIMVLPPGTVLEDELPLGTVEEDEKLTVTSMDGQASIHGAFNLNNRDGTKTTVYFCAAVWCDGSNGVAIPAFEDNQAWEPWENTCAALYHEIAELRTNRNIDEVPLWLKTGAMTPGREVGWGAIYKSPYYPTGFAEMPDIPIAWAQIYPQKVFGKFSSKISENESIEVPIQALWPNEGKENQEPNFLLHFKPQMRKDFYYKTSKREG